MKVVEKYGKLENCWYADNNWDHAKVLTLWNKIAYTHIYANYTNSITLSRVESLSWTTIYTHMIKKGAFKKTREACIDDNMWTLSVYNDD